MKMKFLSIFATTRLRDYATTRLRLSKLFYILCIFFFFGGANAQVSSFIGTAANSFPNAYVESSGTSIQFEDVSIGIQNTGIRIINDCNESRVSFVYENHEVASTTTEVYIEIEENIISYTGDPSVWVESSPSTGQTRWTRTMDMPSATGMSPSVVEVTDFTFVLMTDQNAFDPFFAPPPVEMELSESETNRLYRTTIIHDRVAILTGVNTFSNLASVSPLLADLMNPTIGGSATAGHLIQLVVDGVLYIDVPTVFFFGTTGTAHGIPFEVILREGARVEVLSGSTLNMSSARVRGCDKMADGISVQPGGTLVASNSSFSDCHKAIDFPAIPVNASGTLSLNGCSFLNNYIGLNVEFASFRSLNLLGFLNNTFDSNSWLLSEHSGYADDDGFVMVPPMPTISDKGLAGIYLQNYTDFNPGSGNSFSNLAYGIVANSSNMNLKNMAFENITADALYEGRIYGHPTGTAISAVGKGSLNWLNLNKSYGSSSMSNCVRGVNAVRMAGIVKSTTMEEVERGIDWKLSRGRDIRIEENMIGASKYGIHSLGNEPFAVFAGVDHAGHIFDNDITIYEEDGIGIFANEIFSGNDGWTIEKNEIEVLERNSEGIRYSNGENALIRLNGISTQSEKSKGILAKSSAGLTLQENTVIGAVRTASNGIECRGTSASLVECNSTDGYERGMWMIDVNSGATIRTNVFDPNSSTALVYGNDVMTETNIGVQQYSGNLWHDDYISGNGGRNFSVAPLSQVYLVDGSEDSRLAQNGFSEYTFSPGVDPDPWFDDLPHDGLQAYCFPGSPDGTPPHGECPPLDGFDESIALGTYSSPYFEEASLLRAEYRLLGKLSKREACEEEDSFYRSFQNTKAGEAVGQLAWVAEQRAELFDLNTFEINEQNVLRTRMTEAEGFLLDLENGPTGDQDAYEEAKMEYTDVVSAYNDWIILHEEKVLNEALNLREINANITGESVWVNNQRTVNDLAFSVVIDGELPKEISVLEAIANQCPLSGGDAVYEARSLLGNTVEYDDDILCQSVVLREAQNESQNTPSKNFGIVPNPSSGQFFISGLADLDSKIRVYDNIGRLVLETQSARVDLGLVQNGIYRVEILTEGQRPVSRTISIVSNK